MLRAQCLFCALYISSAVGRGFISRRFCRRFYDGEQVSGNNISAASPQSSSARGSSKPLPYNVKIGFRYESNFTKSVCIFMRIVYLAL